MRGRALHVARGVGDIPVAAKDVLPALLANLVELALQLFEKT